MYIDGSLSSAPFDSGRTTLPAELPALNPEDLECRQQQVLNGGMMAVFLAALNDPALRGDVRFERLNIRSEEDLEAIRGENTDPDKLKEVEELRRKSYGVLRDLFNLGLLPQHPTLTGDEIAILMGGVPIRLHPPGLGMNKYSRASYSRLYGEIRLGAHAGVITVLHESIHHALEVNENGQDLKSRCNSIREALVQLIAQGGVMARNTKRYTELSEEGESREDYSTRTFRDLKAIADTSRTYSEDIRLLAEICDGDFQRVKEAIKSLFDPSEVDKLEASIGGKWGVSMGLETGLSSLRQIGEIVDGGGFAEILRSQMLEALSSEGVKIDKDVFNDYPNRSIRVMSCRWAVLNQKGKTEEAKNLKLEIEKGVRKIILAAEARREQRVMGRDKIRV